MSLCQLKKWTKDGIATLVNYKRAHNTVELKAVGTPNKCCNKMKFILLGQQRI